MFTLKQLQEVARKRRIPYVGLTKQRLADALGMPENGVRAGLYRTQSLPPIHMAPSTHAIAEARADVAALRATTTRVVDEAINEARVLVQQANDALKQCQRREQDLLHSTKNLVTLQARSEAAIAQCEARHSKCGADLLKCDRRQIELARGLSVKHEKYENATVRNLELKAAEERKRELQKLAKLGAVSSATAGKKIIKLRQRAADQAEALDEYRERRQEAQKKELAALKGGVSRAKQNLVNLAQAPLPPPHLRTRLQAPAPAYIPPQAPPMTLPLVRPRPPSVGGIPEAPPMRQRPRYVRRS
jgi:hypothetical protein